MAVKDSEELKANERYPLGDYSFRIERTSVPGSSNDKIEAICTDKDGKNARKSIQVPSSTQIEGWYVEANETEATVYVTIASGSGGIPSTVLSLSTYVRNDYLGDYYCGTPFANQDGLTQYIGNAPVPSEIAFTKYNGDVYACLVSGQANKYGYFAIATFGGTWHSYYPRAINNVNVFSNINAQSIIDFPVSTIDPTDKPYSGEIAGGTYLLGRFAINLEDAGGDGPGSDWIDPGDYDPDWEEGDPTHTLYVTVTGALSGRHNDPIEDPSYSYIPADKDTVKDYGCGGDGGHGGGGGAGASTVVIHKFATNQANSKEVTAIARRHGYGSGGGKGGKGGDGCILVYY